MAGPCALRPLRPCGGISARLLQYLLPSSPASHLLFLEFYGERRRMVPLPKRSHSARRCSAKPAGRTMVPLTLSHCTVAVQGGSALYCWHRRDTETVELRLYPANVRPLRLRRNLNFQQFDSLTREGEGSFRTRLRFQNLTSSSFLRLVVGAGRRLGRARAAPHLPRGRPGGARRRASFTPRGARPGSRSRCIWGTGICWAPADGSICWSRGLGCGCNFGLG